MKRSTDRILTTHTGSLPRPPQLRAALRDLDQGKQTDREWFDATVRQAVDDVVARQVETGISVVNDGEMAKVSYVTYVTQRLGGFGGQGRTPPIGDARDYPEWAKALGLDDISHLLTTPACVGDVAYVDRAPLETELASLKAAVEAHRPDDVFMSAASPGVIAFFLENQHYAAHEDYVRALGAAMRTEYEAIHEAGFVLQIDCPDLAMGRHNHFSDLPLDEWRTIARLYVDVINDATRNIPKEDMRLHLCWGNYPGPHHLDVPLSEIIDIVLEARPAGLSFEAANPRHAHEWRVFADIELPTGKVLIPGVIDSTTNYVEHPELVGERILNFARCVGAENVIAGTDCGFGTTAQSDLVDARIVYAKLRSLADGAELASGELWHGRPVHRKVTLATS